MPKRITITEKRRPTPDPHRLVHALLLFIQTRATRDRLTREARHDDSR